MLVDFLNCPGKAIELRESRTKEEGNYTKIVVVLLKNWTVH